MYDNHNHCQFSFDGGRTSVEASARSAAEKGLEGICFTDHCDFYVPPMKAEHEECVPEVFEVEARDREIDRVNGILSEEFPGFRIFKGIEIGLQKSEREKISAHLAEFSFDEVIASVHYLDGTDPFWGGYYEGKDWKTAYGHYLETLYEEMVWLGDRFDIMGHYDYVARYAPYPQCSILLKDFPDVMDEILRYLAENGKALEINTKTYQSYSGRVPEPDRDILRRFRELGGEMLSFGSDSHDAGHVGFNFGRMSGFVKSCGYRYAVHFEKRKPVMCRI
ncbi:MAG: histidinol-phosphatase HisJ family protein [Candidatus Cryptobacteroides sp.]